MQTPVISTSMKIFTFSDRSIASHDIETNELLGHGKYDVYKGQILSKKEDCAVKIFPNTQMAQSAFLREKRVLSGLRHRHIVNFIPSMKNLDQGSNHRLVMEYAPYGDFFDIVMSRELKEETLIRTYFHQLIEGLEYLHSKGIAHLDLKLDNLLLGKNYLLKITDFDLAHSVKESAKPVSRGTTGYRAPEVWHDIFENIFAADIYSIGIILFICFTGEFPFVENETEKGKELKDYDLFNNYNATFWKKKSSYYDVCFGDNLKALFNGMLMKDPSQRFTFKTIKSSTWYQGEVVENLKLEKEMESIYDRVKNSSNQ
jgi:serine/threonine protein kinase